MRILDFQREKHGIPAVVASIEYDPNRTARLALLHYADGEKRYILAPVDLKVGDTLMSGPSGRNPGRQLPADCQHPGRHPDPQHRAEGGQGGQIVRAAGGSAQLLGKEGDFAQVRLPSGEVRLVHQVCYATVGTIGNVDHSNVKLGKAGRKRHKGIRPTVRGSAMSPARSSARRRRRSAAHRLARAQESLG